jgi:hypothetical protein
MRSIAVPVIRHARDAGGLVDHDDVRIVENEHALALRVARARRGHPQLDALAGCEPMVDLGDDDPIDGDLARRHVPLGDRPRYVELRLDERSDGDTCLFDGPRAFSHSATDIAWPACSIS